jgi:4-hydroxy-3-polyprenylbenzoate decarboxylase
VVDGIGGLASPADGAVRRLRNREKSVTGTAAQRIIIGISGASGVIYGVRALEVLRQTAIETHLVVSKAAEMTLGYETSLSLKDLRGLADVWHPAADIGASLSSGSFPTLGMLVVPCSIRTMSEICTGVTGSLMSRAADVVLKERRRLVLAVRETPLHTGHLRTMTALSEMGAVIAPIVPAFYNRPETLDDIINHSVGRMLDLFGIETSVVKRWKSEPTSAPR